jgi:hypothetical protein
LGFLRGELKMRLHPGMKAGLLLLAIAGTIAAASGTAQARHWRGYYGRGYNGGYYGGGWGGGYGWYGGYPNSGYAYGNYGSAQPSYAYNDGTTTANYGPSAQPMMANQPAMVYGQGGCGNTSTTAAYPPSGPMPGAPGGYNGTTYENGPPTPTYAPRTNAPPVNGQRMDNANDHNATMNPTVGGTPQPGTAADTANDHNATAPPPAPASAPAPGSSSSDTANQHNTTP